jgi:signal transduction histidine kinase
MAGSEVGTDELRGLLAADQMIIGDLELPVVLRRIVQAACQLVPARCGTLVVLAANGGVAERVHVGADGQAAEPDSTISIPIRVRGDAFGTLSLAADGPVTARDEQLLAALAETASIAIVNAQRYARAQSRQTWLQASARITRQLLSVEGEEPLRLIAREARELADADLVTVILPTPDGQRLMVEVASGRSADELIGFSYPVENTYAGQTFKTGEPILLADAAEDGSHYVHLTEVLPAGPVMVVPLVGTQRMRGALVVGRVRGRRRFEDVELDMATTFANHAAVALELADARADQQRVLLLEDRDRIARDLHDHVIQQLFATGLTVQSVAATLSGDARSERLDRVVSGIDDTIRQIRTTIFQLRGPLGPQTGTARARLLDVIAELARVLGFDPHVEFDGPVAGVVPDSVVDDVVAVAREGLSNVARHAQAGRASVRLVAGPTTLALEICDDGVGVREDHLRSGLANLQRRAERLGGRLRIEPDRADGTTDEPHSRPGTRLTWTIPLH